jgi:RNA recognition motif-containing protein
MRKRLYIGNINYKATEGDLAHHFAQAGEVVSARLIFDRVNGRMRGFGFVEMASDGDAERAVEMFDKQPFMDRELVIHEARPKDGRRA